MNRALLGLSLLQNATRTIPAVKETKTEDEIPGEDFDGEVCIRCGHVNPIGLQSCEKCRVPLADYASTVPWEMGKVRESGYADPDQRTIKPIIVWGVWILFGLSAVFFVYDFALLLLSWIGGRPLPVIDPLSAIFGGISLFAVWGVTAAFVKQKVRARSEED